MTLSASGASKTITVTADAAWLAAKDRKYPVVIDPSIWTNVNYYGGGGGDCFIQNTTPTANYCSSGTYTGTTDAMGFDGTNVDRGLYTFNVQTCCDHIVPNANILDAELDLTLASSTSATAVPVTVYPITQAWTSNATWNNADTGVAWTTAGGTIGAALSTTSVGPTTGNYAWFGLTQTVQNWVNGSTANYGFMIKETNEPTTETYTPEFSAEQLSVTYQPYTPTLGIQPWYAFAGPVNVANGNLVLSGSDMSMPGVGLNNSVGTTYNSLSTGTGDVGNGWLLDVGSSLATRRAASRVSRGGASAQSQAGHAILYLAAPGPHPALGANGGARRGRGVAPAFRLSAHRAREPGRAHSGGVRGARAL